MYFYSLYEEILLNLSLGKNLYQNNIKTTTLISVVILLNSK